VNGRLQQAFTELTATLSSTLITQLATAKQVNTEPASPVGVDDTPRVELRSTTPVAHNCILKYTLMKTIIEYGKYERFMYWIDVEYDSTLFTVTV
jgi:hypothetical protein